SDRCTQQVHRHVGLPVQHILACASARPDAEWLTGKPKGETVQIRRPRGTSALSSTAEHAPDKRGIEVRLFEGGLWSKPKQSRHEAVTLALVGASPTDHPTRRPRVLTVETPRLPVKQSPIGQLGASPSSLTQCTPP